ncbi:MAG: type 4a pilus biogenesis protein PilO [bacterium]
MITKLVIYTKEHQWKVLMYLCVLLFLLVILKVIIPEINQIGTIKDSIKEHQEKINLAYSKTDVLYALKRSKKNIGKEIQQLVNSQKEGREISTILNFISESAQKKGVEIQTLQVDEISPQENHLELPLQCTVKGTFHPLCYFINCMENSDIIINIEKVMISKQHIASDELQAEIALRVFYLRRLEL